MGLKLIHGIFSRLTFRTIELSEPFPHPHKKRTKTIEISSNLWCSYEPISKVNSDYHMQEII